ncbi:Geraniol 8-hydroxylase [Dendrobium catenatum]|uniref:Geraniol 8-hydroxylase n=1 Tax=Dendrobium catenatum TaxID=906689 RepID=A0A2I0VQI8_9ASPA|nr:Geraniol 8-hydroxylase [Dendrobium catenatum]
MVQHFDQLESHFDQRFDRIQIHVNQKDAQYQQDMGWIRGPLAFRAMGFAWPSLLASWSKDAEPQSLEAHPQSVPHLNPSPILARHGRLHLSSRHAPSRLGSMRETSSTTLEWAMAELLRRPELMKRAREEIITVVGFEREIEESDISKLPLLQAILKETLRLHPPVPLLLPHKAEVSTEINGYLVPKNTQVLVNVWAIGRDEQVWEKPDCFMPERFMEAGSSIDFRGQHFELIPFGSGRRICPGLPLGVRMVQLMLASLIQSFEWSLPDGMKPQDLNLNEQFGITLNLASPLKALAIPVRKM